MKKRYYLYIAASAFLIGLSYKAVKKHSKDSLAKQFPSIVRLHRAKTGDFLCTGVVINNTSILTAAHCIAKSKDDKKKQEHEDDSILVKSPLHPLKSWFGTSGNYNEEPDVGVIHGDFKGLPHMPFETSANVIDNQLTQSYGNIIACGFPYGGKLTCSDLTDSKRFDFLYTGKGFLFPGMSGGPVINLDTGAVVAVNSAVRGDYIFVAPLIELQDMLNVKF